MYAFLFASAVFCKDEVSIICFVENGELPMSLGEQVLLVRTHCLRTHDKRENMRSRAAEDCCPFGLMCACTWMCVRMRVCVCAKEAFSFGFRYDMMIG